MSVFHVCRVREQFFCAYFEGGILSHQDDLTLGHVVRKYLTAVAAWRDYLFTALTAHRDYRLKQALPRGYRRTDSHLFRAGAVQRIDVDANIYLTVRAAYRRADGVAVSAVVIVCRCLLYTSRR